MRRWYLGFLLLNGCDSAANDEQASGTQGSDTHSSAPVTASQNTPGSQSASPRSPNAQPATGAVSNVPSSSGSNANDDGLNSTGGAGGGATAGGAPNANPVGPDPQPTGPQPTAPESTGPRRPFPGFGQPTAEAPDAGASTPGSEATDPTQTEPNTTPSPTPSTAGPDEDCTPDYECEPEAPDTGDFYADCVTRVNQFRACVCLPALERAPEAEDCMDQQAEYDSTRDPHSGFSDGICDPSGNAQDECPGWRDSAQVVDGCLQMMFDEGPPPMQPCEGQCYQDHGHFINMTGTRYTRVACGIYDDGEKVWSVQNFF
ncbi:MAG TPA: hypothetical protein VHM70_23435 [Polyangiaceae bacterium]|nr:hypothetical protein [Polyangiaceae bacterium]